MNADLMDLKLESWLRARNNGSLVWKTKDGTCIPIKDMTDQHLVNSINMLERRAEEEANLEDAIEGFDWEKFGW